MSDLLFYTNYSPSPSDYFVGDQIKSIKMYKAKNPTISFFAPQGNRFASRGRPFQDGEYDLYEAGRIIDTESLVSRAFNKKNTLVFRDGFTIKSKNEKNLAYIKRRLSEIEYVSEKTFDEILREYAYNLVAFHNPYLVKVRKESASSGLVRKYRGKRAIDPVAAYFCLAPETMQKRINDSGDPIRYRQYLGNGGKYREFADYNIIHTPFNKRTGFTMGTPPLESVREDILALRRIEESVETLIYKSLFPIIHVKVGTDKHPAKTLPGGMSEVDAATKLLENVDDNGGIVTSERVDIGAIGAESLALRVETYLEYFKKRVFAGLGMSAIDFGDGDSTGRATGEVLSSALRDSVITYQYIISEMITKEVFTELLLESGRYEHPFEIDEDDRVELVFNTVDTSETIKKESHTLNKMSHGILKVNEAREELGLPPLTESDFKDLHSVKMQQISSDQQLEVAKATAKLQPKTPTAGSSTTKKTAGGNTKSKQSKSEGAKNSTKSITTPKNQNSDSSILSNTLAMYSENIADINLVMKKIHRELLDYSIRDMSHGLIDSRDFIPQEIEVAVDNSVSELFDFITEPTNGFSEIRSELKKTIDKLSIYVNNIDLGS